MEEDDTDVLWSQTVLRLDCVPSHLYKMPCQHFAMLNTLYFLKTTEKGHAGASKYMQCSNLSHNRTQNKDLLLILLLFCLFL